jgi:hypothetical protein
MIGLDSQQRQHALPQIRVLVMPGSILISVRVEKLTAVAILSHLPNHKINAALAPVKGRAAGQLFAGGIESQLTVSEFRQDWFAVALLQEFSREFSFYLGEIGDSGIHGFPQLNDLGAMLHRRAKIIVATLSDVQPTHTEYGSMLLFGVQSKPVSLRNGSSNRFEFIQYSAVCCRQKSAVP